MRHGASTDPPNRFLAVHQEPDFSHVDWDCEYLAELHRRPVRLIDDTSRSIVSENHSPDIPFRYSLNPYRGCQHGCAYCYARNTHEFLGMNAGLDFETQIVVKRKAPALFEEFLADETWQPQEVVFSGVTDCYQPVERQLQLTRQCLEVASRCQLPVGIVTKNALVVRDLDVLRTMAIRNQVHVSVSITTLNPELARSMEPQTSTPAARLRAIELLSEAGIPVRVMTAPVIPGLNDSEIPQILEAARKAGATAAGYILLRLPLTVEPVFREWLQRTQGTSAAKIEGLIRNTRQGRLNNSDWSTRMRGQGEFADQIARMFRVFSRKFGYSSDLPPLDFSGFSPPRPRTGQLRLF
jgi:DNA repair photolyase